jgi:hypothetical protein
MVLPALRDSCLLLCVVVCVGQTKSAISQPCAVRLSWNLETWGWYPRLACMFWLQDLIIFYIVNKQNTKNAKIVKIAVLQNLRFLSRAKSEIWNLVGTSKQVLGIVWYVCFVYIIDCLRFVNVNKENTLYGSFGCLQVKSFETWWMSSPKLNTQSWFFFLWFDRLFMFHGYKQTARFGAILKNAKTS